MDNSNSPIIVVCSEGEQNSLEIINNIRKLAPTENTIELADNVTGYKFRNVTKYYENDIVFISHESKHINSIPVELIDRVEGCIIYFDATNKDFLHKLPVYANFIETNNIEFGILLCRELFDNSLDGITYKEAKSCCNTLDVIELERERDSSRDDGNAGHHDPIGYDELLQAIRAIVWSNVEMKRKAGSTQAPKSDDEEKHETEDADDGKIEAELEGFEQLLNEVMMFKETTASWSRTERLAYAEKFAYAFDNLLQNGGGGGGKKSSTNENYDSSDSD